MAMFIENVTRLWNGAAQPIPSPTVVPPSPHILSSSPPDFSMELYVMEYKLVVCSVPKNVICNLMHPLVKIAILPQSRPKFFSLTETNEDYTIILVEELFKELGRHEKLERSEHPWRVLTVSAGALGAADLVGVSKIAKSIIGPLADNEISVLCMSTYQSDYILIQEPDFEDAINCLSVQFKIFNENHEKLDQRTKSVTSHDDGITGKVRPVIHPFVSPKNKYHITGLDSSLLPSVTHVLLELMFFPENQSLEAESVDGADKGDTFFHFSVVSGDISFVLSSSALAKFPENTLYTATNDECWRMIKIGDSPLGFEEPGIVAQVAEPIADERISGYYISTFYNDHSLVCTWYLVCVCQDFHLPTVRSKYDEKNTPNANAIFGTRRYSIIVIWRVIATSSKCKGFLKCLFLSCILCLEAYQLLREVDRMLLCENQK